MADNYLEKKFEDLRSGRQVIKRVNPSLDSLLSRIGSADAGSPSSYQIKKAQLDAVSTSVLRLQVPCHISCDEAAASISLSCRDAFCLGRLCLAAELKAAELKFSTSITIKEDAEGEFPIGALISFYR